MTERGYPETAMLPSGQTSERIKTCRLEGSIFIDYYTNGSP